MNLFEKYPMVTLGNNLCLVNFGLQHALFFTTGEILHPCPEEISRRFELKMSKQVHKSRCGRYADVGYDLNEEVFNAFGELAYLAVDIILVTQTVRTAAQEWALSGNNFILSAMNPRKSEALAFTATMEKIRTPVIESKSSDGIVYFSDKFCR